MAKNVIDIPYVEPHGKAWRYRRYVPGDVKDAIGKGRWVKTFRARTPLAVIEAMARRLAVEHDRLIERARAGEVLSPEVIAEAERQARQWLAESDRAAILATAAYVAETAAKPSDAVFLNALEHGGKYTPEGLTLSAVYARDKERYGGERDEKPINAAVDSFVATNGDAEITKISRGDVAEWIARLTAHGMAPGTMQRRLGALRAIVNRALLDLDISARNPFEKQTVKGGNGRSDDRLPFNRAMLAKVESYIASNGRLGHETKNIIRLMKGTGCGPGEIGGLVLSDMSLDGNVPFVWVRANAIRGVKTDVRDRRIPLVGEALEAAKDAYKRAAVRSKGKNADELPLFTGFGASGRGADSLSAKLNKAIRAAGVPKSPRLSAYSFRHTMKEALRSAGVVDHVQRRLLGHAGAGVADRYGSPQGRLQEAKAALEAAMSHLGDVDEAIYSAKERIRG